MAWAKMIEELKKKQPSTLGRGDGYAIWWIIYQLVDGNGYKINQVKPF